MNFQNRTAFLLAAIAFVFLISRANAASESSAINITPDGKLLLVANPDSNSVSILDISSSPNKLAELLVGDFPQTVVSDENGQFAFATNRNDDNLTVLDLTTLTVAGCVPVKDEPFGVVADENLLYVSNQGSSSITVIDRSSWLSIAEIETENSPRGLALSADGSRLYVSHFFSGKLSIINTDSLTVEKVISISRDANISQSIEIDSNEEFAYLSQTFSNSTNPALLFDTTVFPAVSIVDLNNQVNLRKERISLDIVDEPVGIPIDSELTSAGILYVVNAGSNDISVIDVATKKNLAHLQTGSNPRGIALSLDENTAYINNTLSGTISVLDTQLNTLVDEISVTEIPLTASILNGKKLFNSSSRTDLSRDQWISCATCHFDGEHDGRTWFFPDGQRNTPSLLGMKDTAPFHWSGDLDEVHDVEITVRDIQAGTGLAEGASNCDPSCGLGASNQGRSEDLDDLAAYLETLQIASNPNLASDGSLINEAQRGRELFNSVEVGCSSCHSPPLYTDQQKHDVGTGGSLLEKKGSAIDTPSLRGVYKTAPYLHDGSAATLGEVLTVTNFENSHGTTSQLSESEKLELVAFIQSLPTGEESGSDSPPTECIAPNLDSPQIQNLLMSLNQSRFTAGDQLTLAMQVTGEGVVDLYIAFVLPNDSYLTIGPAQKLSEVNEAIAYQESATISATESYSILDIVLPEGVESGNYSVVAVIAARGSSVLDSGNWIATHTLVFELF